jgi:B12-binding domain/radical SAM domain protein
MWRESGVFGVFLKLMAPESHKDTFPIWKKNWKIYRVSLPIELYSKEAAMQVRILSPDLYTYGAMLIGGIVRSTGAEVTISRELSPGKDTVFLSLYSTQHLLQPRIRSFVRQHREAGGTVYIGGPVSSVPGMVIGELSPDAIVVGEGEVTVRRLVSEGLHPELPGVAYREDNGSIRVNSPDIPPTLERPLPLIPEDIGSQSIRGANVYIETHRGCLGACTFCQVPRFFGHTIRSRSLDEIVTEARAFRERGVARISISGGTGSLYRYEDGKINTGAFVELLRELARVMGEKNVSAPDIRVDCINDEVLEAIRDYTIGWVFFGIESGSDAILHLMGKGTTVARMKAAVEECRNHRLRVAGSFIVGYPTETQKDYEQTKSFVAEMQLDDVFVSIAEPIPGTPLARLALGTPKDMNPTYIPTEGEYKSLHLTESEARCFDLMMHADLFKPRLHVVTDQIYSTYLQESRKQGSEIRAVTDLLHKYRDLIA